MLSRRLVPSAVALIGAFLALTQAEDAQAGPNENGTLILHAADVLIFSDDGVESNCELVAEEGPLLDCADAVTNTPGSGPAEPGFWAVYAAFPPGSSPRLTGVTFGVDYDDDSVFLLDAEMCGDFELPGPAWPAPGQGTAVTWSSAQTDQLVQIYVFVGYGYYSTDTSFDVIPNPNGGGHFADDAVPANVDPIADYGRLGFNDNPGYLPCPVGDPLGACCFVDCSCEVLTEAECAAADGLFQGEGTVCDPNPCVFCPPPGACCFDGGDCEYIDAEQCSDSGGEFLGEDTFCDPSPCPVPTIDATWGAVKSEYR